MTQWCVDNGVSLQASADSFYKSIENKRFLIAAQELQECLGKQLEQCLREVLLTDVLEPSILHQLIPKIGWASIFTSNYDALLEGAFSLYNKGRLIPVYTRENTASALRTLRASKSMIFKMHGDIDRPETIVLGQRDYGRVLYSDPAYRSFLENIFSSYTVLFVGMGADDPDLNGVIDRLSTVYEGGLDHHFMLVSDSVFTELEARRLLSDKQIKLITYRADESHSQVEAFFCAVQTLTSHPGAKDVISIEKETAAKAYLDTPEDTAPKFSRTLLSGNEEKAGRRVFVFRSGANVEKPITDRIKESASYFGLDLRYAEDALQDTFDQNDVPIPHMETFSWEIGYSNSVLLILSDGYSNSAVEEIIKIALYNNKPIGILRVGDVQVAGSITELSSLQLPSDSRSFDSDVFNTWLSRL